MATLARPAPASPARADPARLGWPLVLAIAILAALAIGWTGFIASDDALYYRGATHWLTGPPFAGDDHWSTRLPLILSFAGWLALLGRGLAAFAATALTWYAALIAIFGLWAARIGGARAGWIAALLAGTMPVIIANATTVSCDLPEACFLVGGAWALGGSDASRHGLLRAFGGGALFGLAILCRETSLLSLTALGPLFLVGRPIDRRALLAAGAGVALVLGAEALFEWTLTGNAVHRYTLAFHHDEHIDRAANLEGNLLVHPAIDPLLVLLVNDDFALIFWVAILAVVKGGGRGLAPDVRRRFTLVAAMAAADFLLVAVLTHKLVLNPRYFLLPALTAALLSALWIARLRPIAASAMLTMIVGTNLLMLSVENAHPRWDAEALVLAARTYPDVTIATDRAILGRADLPLAFAGLGNATTDSARAELALVPGNDAGGRRIVTRYPSPATKLGSLIEALRLAALVPAPVARRLFAPNPEMVLVATR